MFPKEHGAYGQLGFPLVTSLIVAGPATASLLVAIAAVAFFLAHEPMLVLLGHRGVRARTVEAHRAGWWLIGTLIAGTATGLLALDATHPALRWTFLVPALPGAWVAYAAIRGCEKTSLGETSAAIAFALVAVPIGAAADRVAVGAAIGVAFALLFALATLAVRVIVLRTRGGGNQLAVRQTRAATAAIAGVGVLVALLGASDGVVTWFTIAAIVPGIFFVAALAAFPPPATRLRKVGWSLVAVSALTSVLLIVAA